MCAVVWTNIALVFTFVRSYFCSLSHHKKIQTPKLPPITFKHNNRLPFPSRVAPSASVSRSRRGQIIVSNRTCHRCSCTGALVSNWACKVSMRMWRATRIGMRDFLFARMKNDAEMNGIVFVIWKIWWRSYFCNGSEFVFQLLASIFILHVFPWLTFWGNMFCFWMHFQLRSGHTVAAVLQSFHLAKDCGFKVCRIVWPIRDIYRLAQCQHSYVSRRSLLLSITFSFLRSNQIIAHMMPDLPNMGFERDLEQVWISRSVLMFSGAVFQQCIFC